MIKSSEERCRRLDELLLGVEETFGKGSLIRRRRESDIHTLSVISTGSIGLNSALGVGGYTRGQIIEIYGGESSGKTTLALHAIVEAQRVGCVAAFIDVERAFDSHYARRLGVDLSRLLLSQPENGEQALEIVEEIASSSAVGVVVVDSVAALTTRAEAECGFGETTRAGSQAELMRESLRKLKKSISRSDTICIFTNQLRERVGGLFGAEMVTTGGNALMLHAAIRLEISRESVIKRGEDIVGARTKVAVVRDLVASNFSSAEFDVIFGDGISRVGEVIDMGVYYGIITKLGSWYLFEDRRLAQGRDSLRQLLVEDNALFREIESRVVAMLGAL